MESLQSNKNSVWTSILILFGLTIGCLFVSQIIVLVAFLIGSGGFSNPSHIQTDINQLTADSSGFMYSMLAVGSIGSFLLPALGLQYFERNQYTYFEQDYGKFWIFSSLAIALLISTNPLMSVLSEWNVKMKLPDGLTGIEQWMRLQEDQMATLTENLVMTTSWSAMLINILVIAVLPAISEEFFFRGAVQNILLRAIKNPHVAIWFGAIIFSAIHFQFYGFLPRMFLGAVLGYLYFWTRNIWVPILTHFVNNSSVVVIAFIYTKKGKGYAELMSNDNYHIAITILSILVSIFIWWTLHKIQTTRKDIHGAGLVKD